LWREAQSAQLLAGAMRDRDLRVLLLSALRPAPDFSRLSVLRNSSASQLRKMLRWLDQSGLALYLLTQLQDHGALGHLPEGFSKALEHRLTANGERTLAMLGEFGRLVESFHRNGIEFCALKGFTLTPEFCRSASLRHQTDLDFLVAEESLEKAKRAMRSCGYEQQVTREADEVTFATPLLHIPSPNDDIYAIPRHREVDLITTLRYAAHGVSIDAPTHCFDRLESNTLQGVSFPALPAEEMFCLQVMHAFTHLLGSWVRVSWLFEIGHFIDRHHNDADLWRAIIERMGCAAKSRNAFGLVISLTNTLFPRRIPQVLDHWCLRALPPRIETWITQFGVKTAIADLDGAKWTLFVHREFVDHPNSWGSYVRQRVFPVRRRSSIGIAKTGDLETRIKVHVSQWRHTVRRSMFHAGTLFSLPVEAIRWKYALRSLERQRVLASPVLTR
jgi:Uncharacterised nucleotidyltransferase